MKIYFKSGREEEIIQEIAKVISERIISGAKQWQCFNNTDGVFLIVNLDEIEFIR